jgi:hypothetical protein
MPHRRLRHVEWARECERPKCIPRPKLVGAPARGLAFERSLARVMRSAWAAARYGQWYEYRADGEPGYCQPDFVHLGPSAVHVVECKLANVEEATEQLFDLYFPVLRAAYAGRLVRGLIVTRSVHRVPSSALVVPTLAEALAVCDVRVPVLHWIGRGTL